MKKQKTLVKLCVNHFGSQAKLAEALARHRRTKVTTSYVHQWLHEDSVLQPQTAHELEIITKGLVKRVDFYPKLFGDLQQP